MRILVTNDDGISAAGLHHLAEGLRAPDHEVLVVAPCNERSGSSSSLGTVVDGEVITVRTDGSGANATHSLDGPPALAVRAACTGAFGPVPDIVVAGINPALNTGRRVLHSGTVGAALTAAAHDVPGVAVSAPGSSGAGVTAAVALAGWTVDALAAHSLPPLALSLNVPALALAELVGIDSSTLSRTSVQDVSFDAVPGGLRVRRDHRAPPYDPGSDADLLHHGRASFTDLSRPWSGNGRDPSRVDGEGIVSAVRLRWRRHCRPDTSV